MIYPQNFENKIGFDRILEQIQNVCLSPLGKLQVENINFETNRGVINNLLEEVSEFKNICLNHDDFPIDYYYDLTNSFERIRVEGLFFEVVEIYNLRKTLGTVKKIIQFFKKHAESYPIISQKVSSIKYYPFVTERIDQILNKHGKIKDNASFELKNIRNELIRRQNSVSKVVNSILKKAVSDGLIDKETSISMRDGRAVLPVSATNKRKISGLVHDMSASGKTAFIEPIEVVEINNAIKELEYAEQREIKNILIEFTESVKPYIEHIAEAFYLLGQLDFIRAKALFAIKTNSIKPKIETSPFFYWNSAVHPLLEQSLKAEGKNAVPLTVELNNEQRIVLISGPNAGGKSVCIQTVGLLQYMLQCGLLVPMNENSTVGIYEKIFIDIGDEQSIENDLSTYSSHLLNMKYFIKNANENTLILIDEFGSGTEPMLGGAIAESILNKLNNKKINGVITTHYTNLKHFASSVEGIQNGAMLYDMNKLQPLFILEIGKPGSSFAFEIAHKIGLPNDVIENAKEKIGEEHIHFDKHLKEIIRDKRYWENKRKRIRKTEKKLEETYDKYAIELNETIALRKKILAEAKQQAEKILQESNRKIEYTIRKIKEHNAEKEKTREIRKELENFKSEVSKLNQKEHLELERKINKYNQKQPKLSNNKADLKKDKSLEGNIIIGDFVRIKGQENIGEVIDKNKENLVVAFGQLITTVKMLKVDKVDSSEKPMLKNATTKSNLSSFNLHKKRLNFKSGLDVRGMRVDEALQTVTDYIDEAIMLNVSEVRILHGKGNGILRQVIREYLSTINLIKSYKDEHIELGGAGITVVNF
ncbi:MAG: endonuclease MutS2 [Chlorobi bacterium]|nr:endonuclease MutS2 [Chlorobiota bacterium]